MHPVLAHHVVSGRQHVPERRPTQDDLAGVRGDAVGQVGLAAGDQRDVAVAPARVVQHVGQQRPDDLRVGALVMRSRRCAVGSLKADTMVGVPRAFQPAVAGRRKSGDGCRRASERPVVMRGVAELALAHDDAAKEPVRGVLRGEGDAAEDLQRSMGDLARGARDIGLGDRGRLLGVGDVVVECGRGVQDGRPRAGVADVHVGHQVP